MSAAPANLQLASREESEFPRGKTFLVEPLLIVSVAAFWLLALPFVAVSLVCVKVGDALVSMEGSRAARPNPLFLRRACAPEGALVLLRASEQNGAGRV
jgi:hypothetical protein